MRIYLTGSFLIWYMAVGYSLFYYLLLVQYIAVALKRENFMNQVLSVIKPLAFTIYIFLKISVLIKRTALPF